MYNITLPSGSHKKSKSYAFDDLTPGKYRTEVFSTLIRALSEKYEKSQKAIKNEVSGKKKEITEIIDGCYPDTSVTNCVKKVMDNYSSFFNKEIKEKYVLTLEEYSYWNEMCEELVGTEHLDESESNLDSTISKYAEEYAEKIIRGKKVPVSKLKSILKKVHSRGMQAFRNAPQSVRPWIRKMGDPAGAIVWGTSRIKAFLKKSKGTWHKFDSDLAKDVKDSAK